jgi:hypothetical protein
MTEFNNIHFHFVNKHKTNISEVSLSPADTTFDSLMAVSTLERHRVTPSITYIALKRNNNTLASHCRKILLYGLKVKFHRHLNDCEVIPLPVNIITWAIITLSK